MFETDGIRAVLAIAGDNHCHPCDPEGGGWPQIHFASGNKAAPPDHASATEGEHARRRRGCRPHRTNGVEADE